MDTIHQLVITDTNFNIHTIFIDAIKPRGAKRCFICTDKFMGQYKMLAANDTFDMVEVHCNALQNSYRYNTNSNAIIRNDVLDIFMTANAYIEAGNVNAVKIFNTVNNKDNWMEIDINTLPNLNISFVTSPVAIVNLSISYNLHLKIKFE